MSAFYFAQLLGRIQKERREEVQGIPQRSVHEFTRLCAQHGVIGGMAVDLYKFYFCGHDLTASSLIALRARPRSRRLLEVLQQLNLAKMEAEAEGFHEARGNTPTDIFTAAQAVGPSVLDPAAEPVDFFDFSDNCSDSSSDNEMALSRLLIRRLSGFCEGVDTMLSDRLVHPLDEIFSAVREMDSCNEYSAKGAALVVAQQVQHVGFQVAFLLGDLSSPYSGDFTGVCGGDDSNIFHCGWPPVLGSGSRSSDSSSSSDSCMEGEVSDPQDFGAPAGRTCRRRVPRPLRGIQSEGSQADTRPQPALQPSRKRPPAPEPFAPTRGGAPPGLGPGPGAGPEQKAEQITDSVVLVAAALISKEVPGGCGVSSGSSEGGGDRRAKQANYGNLKSCRSSSSIDAGSGGSRGTGGLNRRESGGCQDGKTGSSTGAEAPCQEHECTEDDFLNRIFEALIANERRMLALLRSTGISPRTGTSPPHPGWDGPGHDQEQQQQTQAQEQAQKPAEAPAITGPVNAAEAEAAVSSMSHVATDEVTRGNQEQDEWMSEGDYDLQHLLRLRAAGYLGAVIAAALKGLSLRRALGRHRSLGLCGLLQDTFHAVEGMVQDMKRGHDARAAGVERWLQQWLQHKQRIHKMFRRLRERVSLTAVRATMRRHMGPALLEVPGHPDREDWLALVERSVRFRMVLGQLAEGDDAGRQHRNGLPQGGEDAGEFGPSPGGTSIRTNTSINAPPGPLGLGGVGTDAEGGSVGEEVRRPHIAGAAEAESSEAVKGSRGSGPEGPCPDGFGAAAATSPIRPPTSASASGSQEGSSPSTRPEMESSELSVVNEHWRWIGEELAPLWLQMAQRSLDADVAAGSSQRVQLEEELGEVMSFVELAVACEHYEGDLALLTLLGEGVGVGTGAETRHKVMVMQTRTTQASTAAEDAVKCPPPHRGTPGKGGSGAVAAGGGKRGRRGARVSSRPVLAHSRQLCELLVRRFEYRWPIAVVGAEPLAAVLCFHAVFSELSSVHTVPVWVPLALRPPSGLQSTDPQGPGGAMRERAGGGTGGPYGDRAPDPYQPRPGYPGCLAIQFLGRMGVNPILSGLEDIRVDMQGQSFGALFSEIHRNVRKRGCALLHCSSVEDVQLAALLAAKVRDDMLSNHLQDVACITELSRSDGDIQEWAQALHSAKCWMSVFQLIDDGRRGRLGRLTIIITAIHSRNGTRTAKTGLTRPPLPGLEAAVAEAGSVLRPRGGRGLQQRAGAMITRLKVR